MALSVEMDEKVSDSAQIQWPIPGRVPQCVLVTGGAGFIGSNFLNAVVNRFPEIQFVNLDKLTYAGNLGNLVAIADSPNYRFVQADIVNFEAVKAALELYRPDWIVHFAAESHVDRSILGPGVFVQTNVVGTFNLLEQARHIWTDFDGKAFHHVSTDEVFGALSDDGFFTETTPYDPSSPYSSSKAGSDHLVRAYGRTYGMPIRITNCSNNYGPYQFPEKLIPLMILNALESKPLPIYGQGLQMRDWLYVEDHCEAIWKVLVGGQFGQTYNIGGNNVLKNIQVVETVCDCLAAQTGRDPQQLKGLIQFVTDRPGHDYRYAIDASKIKEELGWQPRESFESGISKTVSWYLDNTTWIEDLRTGAYKNWVEQNYVNR